MKTTLTASALEMVESYDKELKALLQTDLKNFTKENPQNLINFNTRRFDLELQLILQDQLLNFKESKIKQHTLAKVG